MPRRHPSQLKPKPFNLVKCTLNELFFPVKIVEVSDYIPGMLTTSENEYMVIGEVEPGVEKLLYSCSRQYKLVPNQELFNPIEEQLRANNINFTVTYQHNNHKKFYADYVLDDYKFNVGGKNKDVIKPKIQIQHSYDGGMKFNIIFGIFRMVCSNGLSIPLEGTEQYAYNVSGKHTKNIEQIIAGFQKNLELFIKDWGKKEILNIFKTMTEKKVKSIAERTKEVAEFTKFPMRLINDAIEIAERERVTLGYVEGNDWLVYNGLNEVLFSRKTIRHLEKKNEIDAKVLNAMLYENMKTRRKAKAKATA